MLHHLTTREKVIIMLAVMSGLFLAALDQTIVGTALPKILGEFNALQQLSWVVTAYLLTSTIAVPISGKLSDIYGRRRLMLTGITVFVLGSMLCGVSQNITELVAFRAMQGIGAGILLANAFAIIGDLFTARERGKWQGIFGAVFGLSSLVGPLLGGYLTDNHHVLGAVTNWRWTFYINVPVGIVAAGLITRFMPTIVSNIKHAIDYVGAALLSLGLGALIVATTLGGTKDWAWSSPQIVGLFITSAVGLIAFVLAERRASDPIVPLHFFKERTFNIVSILSFLFGTGLFGTIIYIPLFAQEVLGSSATNSGIIILPMVVGLTISSVVSGRLVAKTGKYKKILLSGMLIGTLGAFVLTGLTPSSNYADLAWRMVVLGLGMGVVMPLLTVLAQNSVKKNELGVATSAVQLFRSVGSTIGVAVLGSVLNNVLARKLGDVQSDPFVQFAQAHGQGNRFTDLTVNSLQGILAPQTQAATRHMLEQLPLQASEAALSAFMNFTHLLQQALASSIVEVFAISAGLIGFGFLVTLFLPEKPLEHHEAPVAPAE